MTKNKKSNKDTVYVINPVTCIDCGRSKQAIYSTGTFLCEECQYEQFRVIKSKLKYTN